MENKKINFDDVFTLEIRKLPFELQCFISKFDYENWMWEVFLQTTNPKIEFKILQRGYKLKYVDLSNFLAHRYLKGIGVKPNLEKAQEIMKYLLFKANTKYDSEYREKLISKFKL